MPAPPRTVLLIDDDELSRSVLELYLTEAGYRVVEAENGAAALAQLGRAGNTISLVLCDMQMPGLHGPELLTSMRPLLAPATPVLAMSGSQPAPEQIAMFDAFMLKPPAPEHLLEIVEALLLSGITLPRAGTLDATILQKVAAASDESVVLDETAFAPLCLMLRNEQLVELFHLSFSELDKHLGRMQAALQTGDRAAMHHSAHTVKGSFAIVGARELQYLGALLEAGTGTFADQAATLAQIPLAADRLRRMLSSRGVHLELLPPSD